MADPTGGGNVGILIDVRTAGLDQARAAKAAIADLGNAAGGGGAEGEGASGRIGRLAQAFQHLEQREPSLAVRQGRLAIESLALSAVGAEGPLGRLAATFGLLSAGTGVGLAFLGFTAAAATGLRLLTADLEKTFTTIDAGEKKLGALAAPAPLAQRRLDLIEGRGAIQQLEQLGPLATAYKESSFLEKLSVLLPGGGLGFSTDPRRFGITTGEQTGAVAEAAETRRQTELTTDRLNRARAEIQAAQELAHIQAERAKLLLEETLALDKARLGTHATTAQLEAFAERADRLKLSTANLSPAEKERLEHLEAEARALERLNRAEAITAAQRATEVAGIEARAAIAQPNLPAGLRGFRPGQIEQPQDPRISTTTGEALPGILQGARFREPGYGEHVAHGISPEQAARDARERLEAQKENTAALRAFGAATVELAGGFARAARGDAGAALTGFGAAASTLSRLTRTDEAGNVRQLLPALGPVGDVLGVAGGLISTFQGLLSSGQHKVVISRIEGEALDKLKEVLQIPQNVSAVLVGGSDPRQMRQDLDRLAAKTGVTTLPGRP